MNQFLKDEGALVVLQYGYNGDGGTVFAAAGGSRELKDPVPPPMVAVTPEHYNRIVRLLQHDIPVKLEFDIKAQFIDSPTDSFNVIGEIEGGRKKDEIVMLGAHLDSWHGGTGATDNATGSSVAIEAVRILKALDLKMDRTVRIALWSGEEEGLLGSQAYVKEHFADRETMQPKPEYYKLDAYFNDDTGTGRFRGIGVMGNDQVKPIFEEWLKPFHDLGATAVVGTTGLSSAQARRHRSHVVRLRRIARLRLHAGSHGIRHAHASFEHGRVRSRAAGRSDAGRGHHGRVRLSTLRCGSR